MAAAAYAVEESPGSTERRCRVTPGESDLRDSATENRPPRSFEAAVRVKRCGKSAPRFRQRKRHGKPHREQDRIGAAQSLTAQAGGSDRCPDRRPGRLLKAPGNRRLRGMVVRRGLKPASTEPGLQAGWLCLRRSTKNSSGASPFAVLMRYRARGGFAAEFQRMNREAFVPIGPHLDWRPAGAARQRGE